jgi:AcrR family transcriptional regulator
VRTVTQKTSEAPSRKALRWEEHKERTRRDLLASARTLFAERGYQATSAAEVAAAAGVTERTLFRYFPNKLALVLDELIALLPEMAESIRKRPAGEPPYQAVCEGIIDFGLRHRDMMALAMATEGELELPLDGRQRPLIDFEDTLAEVLRERYAVPAEDQVSPAVWARASIGALRTALVIAARAPRAAETSPAGAPGDPLRACFAALQRGNGRSGDGSGAGQGADLRAARAERSS